MADTLIDRPGGAERRESPSGRAERDRPGDASGRLRETLDDARQQASGVADRLKEEGKGAFARQKDSTAEQVTAVADALRDSADELNRRDPQAGRFVAFAAERLEGFGQQLRARDLDALIDDAVRWGRQSPMALFAGSMALGFLVSRFIKSSASSPRSPAMRSGGAQGRGTARRRSLAAQNWSWSNDNNGRSS